MTATTQAAYMATAICSHLQGRVIARCATARASKAPSSRTEKQPAWRALPASQQLTDLAARSASWVAAASNAGETDVLRMCGG